MRQFRHCLLALLWPAMNAFAQSPPEKNIRPLEIGDTVPDIQFNYLLNYPTTEARLSDFKGKLVILDFWSTWCSSCIYLFPHMDSLQKQFGDELSIILVNTQTRLNRDDKTKINVTLDRVRKRTGQPFHLPVVYDCPELDAYFPCKYVPHEVWINDQGIVLKITSAVEVNAHNIQSLLNNKDVKMRRKRDDFEFERDKALFINGNGGEIQDIKYRSILTGFAEGISGTSIRVSETNRNDITGVSLINHPILLLLHFAYLETKQLDYPKNQWILDVSNKDQYGTFEDSLRYEYLYCYDITLPPSPLDKVKKYIREDLQRIFNITLRKEHRKLDCLILDSSKNIEKSFSRIPAESDASYIEENNRKYFRHYPLSEIVIYFNNLSDKPLINETKLPQDIRINIDLPINPANQAELIAALKNAGFRIKEDTRELEVVVISDK